MMPRPPADSRLELMYARSSNARRSTLITRSIVGLIVRVTIKSQVYPAISPFAARIASKAAPVRWASTAPKPTRRIVQRLEDAHRHGGEHRLGVPEGLDQIEHGLRIGKVHKWRRWS
jgi:hypothetical protein